MNENNNGNNMNTMNFNNNQNQNMYQQTQMNQVPNQFVMTDDDNFAPMPTYNEMPQVQPEISTYNEVPPVQPMPSYNEVPQVQPEIPAYNEVPQVQSEIPAYNEVPQMQPDMNAVPVLDIEEDEVVQTPSDVFGVNVPEEQIQQPQLRLQQRLLPQQPIRMTGISKSAEI